MKRIVTATIAGVALTGAIGIGIAAAATDNGPGHLISDALAGLVSKGTITQEQSDAVARALDDARDEARADREQRWTERQAEVDALLQDTLGMTREQLREELAAGKTLREVAGDNADELVAGATALLKEELDQRVADGRITQEQADEMLARATERADAWLAGEESGSRGFGLGFLLGMGHGRGMGPDGGGMGHHDGRGMCRGWGDDGEAEGGSSTSGTTSTTLWRA